MIRFSVRFTGCFEFRHYLRNWMKPFAAIFSRPRLFACHQRGLSAGWNIFRGENFYHSPTKGDLTWFQGYEEILYHEDKVYECYFHGGELPSDSAKVLLYLPKLLI